MISMNRIQHSGNYAADSIDHSIRNDRINSSKKHPYSFLPTDLWMAKFFLGDKIKTDIYASLLHPFMDTYMKEWKNYEYNHKDLIDALAYARALNAVEDTDSDVFKNIYMKKKTKLLKEEINDEDAKKEITEILTKNISKEEIEKNKNLQSYLMKCRKPLVWYNVDPNDQNRFTNKKVRDDFDKKISKYSIEDVTFNKLSLMIFRDYFESFLSDKKQQLWWDNFQVKIANNYDNVMGWSHLIVKFKKTGSTEAKHFVLHINTQWAKKQMPPEIVPYDFSSSLNTTGKEKPIQMTMKTLDWGNKELLYKFIWNAVDTVKENWDLNKNSIMKAFDSAWSEKSTEHVKKKIIELLSEDSNIAA